MTAFIVTVAALLFSSLACDSADAEPTGGAGGATAGSEGSEGQSCYPNDTCNAGLSCEQLSNGTVCIPAGMGAGGAGGSGPVVMGCADDTVEMMTIKTPPCFCGYEPSGFPPQPLPGTTCLDLGPSWNDACVLQTNGEPACWMWRYENIETWDPAEDCPAACACCVQLAQMETTDISPSGGGTNTIVQWGCAPTANDCP